MKTNKLGKDLGGTPNNELAHGRISKEGFRSKSPAI
jgi:hypothetical protein